jgi:MerR family transcriptional activator of bmr gene
MKNHLSIGEMSKLNNISIQTLRYYDKLNLFKPEYVNKENNYRYYSVRQIFYLDIIKYLKYLGTPLEEIRQVIELKPEDIYVFLDKQETVITEKIKNLEESRTILNQRKELLLEQIVLDRRDKNIVYTRQIPERRVLKLHCSETVTPLVNPDIYFRKLAGVLEAEGSAVDNLYACVYPIKDYKNTSEIRYSSLYTNLYRERISSAPSNISIALLPPGPYLCIAFKWSLEDYYGFYSKLKKAYNDAGYTEERDVYEVSLPQNYAAYRDEDFISELQIWIG